MKIVLIVFTLNILEPKPLEVMVLIKIHTNHILTNSIPETPEQVLLQTVKTQMKCSIMLHFIRVYTVCNGKKDFQTKEYNSF